MIYADGTVRQPFCNGLYAKELWYNGKRVYSKVPYVPQEYIQSSGTQFIDTGRLGQDVTKVVFDGYVVAGDTCLFGARLKNGTNQFTIQCIGTGQYRSAYGSGTTQALLPYYKDSGRHIFIMNQGKTYVDGVYCNTLASTWSTTMSVYNIYTVGAMNTGGTASNKGSVRCYSMQVYEDDVLVRDLVPCLDMAGIACMYDKVEKTFLYNKGTGVFISA